MSQQPKSTTPISFEIIPQRHYPEWGFRPGVPCYPMKMNFIFLNGGAGDYIAWAQAIRWLASECTWIQGNLIHPTYFNELAEYWLEPFPEWNHHGYTELKDVPNLDKLPFRGIIDMSTAVLNATGAHLFTCGWVYYCNKESAPEGWNHYAPIHDEDLDKIASPVELNGLTDYVVITTGVTTESRRVPPQYWNYVINYVRKQGMTPVFLGRSTVETGNARNIHTEFGKELRLDLGINLINRTSLMQAAAIISRSKGIIGHDNGLLHLAGCTKAPIVFGYNLASPKHREPLRYAGHTYNVTLTNEELACNHCQSRTNFLIGQNFRKCFYGDNKCIDMLFENEAERWKRQIDKALNGDKP